MIFEYVCVGLMLLFCFWGGIVGLRSHDEAFPLGSFGRGLLLFNSFVLGVICWAVLVVKLIEILK